MFEITNATLTAQSGQRAEIIVRCNDLFIVAPGFLIPVLHVSEPFIEDGELKSVVTFDRGGQLKKLTASGEVGIARALFLCAHEKSRKLFGADDYLDLLNDKKCGEAFEILVLKNKNEEKRMDCAYRYK